MAWLRLNPSAEHRAKNKNLVFKNGGNLHILSLIEKLF
ncbi:hypothetical protein HPSA20_1477 [Helicobacter pylori SouthAfrica20]|uniref:Uncharacterized protein n=1 Tax=Helicobacter pylori SouthAfrica20 TaxID=1352356 RepID=T1UBC7_HELPX|nr:hypothetical protein HPSA20_1477 [Helicobacter pylori SouthAfrica20]